jgi:hypothetical protein
LTRDIEELFTGAVPHIHVHPDGPGEWSLYGGRFIAYAPVQATVTPTPEDRDPLDFRVVLTADIVDGRLACTSLTAERLDDTSPPITGDGLRRVPVADYVEQVGLRGGALRECVRLNDRMIQLVDFRPPPRDFAEAGMTDETLEQISRIYAAAQATGRKPSGVLLAEYGMPRATSSRWLAVARRRGILVEDHHLLVQRPEPREGMTEEERDELLRVDKELLGPGI